MNEEIKIILEQWLDWKDVIYYQNPCIVTDMWGHTGWYGNLEGSMYTKGDFFTNDASALELFKHEKWPAEWEIAKIYGNKNGIYYQIRERSYGGFRIKGEGFTLARAICEAVLKEIARCQKKPS